MDFEGEHLLPGQIGHFFTILSFIASLVACLGYAKSLTVALPEEKKSWILFSRVAFFIETISLCVIFATLYYIISNHYFEYKYAWQHSDKGLQPQFLLSCFWEGQEGSFMLWAFWHCVLGWAIIRTTPKWEPGVLSIICFAQFCLASMLLGFYFWGAKVGSGPFVLLRNEGILDRAPIFKDFTTHLLRKDYLTLLRDGQGLNVTLQNYWMVIHPPILFLGFASTIVPFAFAMAGLFKKDHSWTKPALSWASFSAAVLGTGIMMGAAWAYESLNFGGYWAWDPVENASLVPWITLVAGIHTNLIYQRTRYSLRTSYFFYIISFCLILYSTFLTRSGILGDTSVHAFTDLGMNTQLLLFLSVFLLPSLVLFGINYNKIPSIKNEESSYSREFWMFIGSVVLLLSAILIIGNTSIPVYNKIFGTKIAPPEDPVFAYNQIQIFIVILVGLLAGTVHYLKYKDTPAAYLIKHLAPALILSIIIGVAICVFGDMHYDKKGVPFQIAIYVAVVSAVYTTVANAAYIFSVLKGKFSFAGSSVAHIGFGLVLLGILLSSTKKEVLSWNTTGIAIFKKNKTEDPAENITLFKGLPTDMGKYMVTYVNDTINMKERKRFFQLDFKEKEGNENFTLYPDVIRNNKGAEGISANPANKHFLTKDIFVYISSFQENNKEDTSSFQNITVKEGDTVFYSNGFMVFHGVLRDIQQLASKLNGDEKAVFLDIEVISKEGKHYRSTPGIALEGLESSRYILDTVLAQSLVTRFTKIDNGKPQIGFRESSAITDLLTLKVYRFPFINVLWIGVVVMVLGFIMSILQKVKNYQSEIG